MKEFITSHPYWSTYIVLHMLTGLICALFPCPLWNCVTEDEKKTKGGTVAAIVIVCITTMVLGFLMIPVRVLLQFICFSSEDEKDSDWVEEHSP